MSSLRRSLRALESWLWTGPAGHLAGGALDFWAALLGYAAARRREGAQAPRARRRRRGRPA